MTDTPVLDFSFLRSFIDTKEEMEEAFEIFGRTTDKALHALANAVTGSDHKKWVEAAHQLKGAASMVGATHMAELCNTAQNLSKDQSGAFQNHFDHIKHAYENTKLALNTEIQSLTD